MPPPSDTTSAAAPATQSLIAGLLREYLGLATEQVVVANQKWRIPPDLRLYLTVSSADPSKPYGASVETAVSADGTALVETVAVPSREIIAVDVYSRGQVAVDRKDEVVLALSSTAMQILCETWAIKVAQIPLSMVDASSLEGAARINRFRCSFPVLRTRTKESRVPYFGTFPKPALVINP